MGAEVMTKTDDRRAGSRPRLRSGILALVQGSAFFGLALVGLALLVVLVLVPALAVLGVVALVGLPPHHGFVLALVLWAGDLLVLRYGVPLSLSWVSADWRCLPGGCRGSG